MRVSLSLRGSAASITAAKTFYAGTQTAAYRNHIHPVKAMQLLEQAICHGYTPPEVYPSTRKNWADIVHLSVKRGLHKAALEEIARCIARGHLRESDVLQLVAGDYIECLMKHPNPLLGKSTKLGDSRAQLLNKAAQLIIDLNTVGNAKLVSPQRYDRLLERMSLFPQECALKPVLSIAIDNRIRLSTKSWNMWLEIAAKRSPETALREFRKMTSNGVRPNKYSITTMLKCLRQSSNTYDAADQVIKLARHLNLYNEFVAVEEMNLLKQQGKYQDLLNVFAQHFGPDTLKRFGLSITVEDSSSDGPRSQLSKQSLGCMIYALVRINPSSTSVVQISENYLAFIKDKKHLKHDVYTLSIFVRAFSRSTATLERAMELLEWMRATRNKPNVVSYTSAIHGLAENGMIDLANKVLQYMKNDKVEPNRMTCEILKQGYAKVHDHENVARCQSMIDKLSTYGTMEPET